MRRRVLAGITLLAAHVTSIYAFQASPPLNLPGSARALVSRADLVYGSYDTATERAIPVGNGRLTALVSTTRGALTLDMRRNGAIVDLDVAGGAGDVFNADGSRARLILFEGLFELTAEGVSVRMVAWHQRDVIAIEIDDRRDVPRPIQLNVKSGRSASRLTTRSGRVLLTQSVEKSRPDTESAIAIALLGRRKLTRQVSGTDVRIDSPAERGRVLILIALARAPGTTHDVTASAFDNIDTAAARSFDDLAGDTAEWWYGFWARGTISLHSADGTAEAAADNYHRYLYSLAAMSCGSMRNCGETAATANRTDLVSAGSSGDGLQASEFEHRSRAAEALQRAMLGTLPASPAADRIIQVFPACPYEWDAHFTLRTGATIVTAETRAGRVESVELRPLAEAIVRLQNPWGAAGVTVTRNGTRWQELNGPLLTLHIEAGHVVTMTMNEPSTR